MRLHFSNILVSLLVFAVTANASDVGTDGELKSFEAMSHAAHDGDPEAQVHLHAESGGTLPHAAAWADDLLEKGSCAALARRTEDHYLAEVRTQGAPSGRTKALLRDAIATGCGEMLATLVAVAHATGTWTTGLDAANQALGEAVERGDPGAEHLACEIATRPNFRDFTLARHCESAAARGDGEAAFRLGIFLDNRSEDHGERPYTWQQEEPRDAPRGVKAALPHYRRAAASGHAGALARLALLHATGDGVKRDDAEAARLARLAVAQDHPEGKMVLGLLMLHGRGGMYDPQQGAALIEQAARRGYAVAQYTMATLHFRGRVVTRDFARAHAWMALPGFNRRWWPSFDQSSVLLLEPPNRTRFVATTTLTLQAILGGTAQAVALRKELADSGEWPLIEEFDARAAALLDEKP